MKFAPAGNPLGRRLVDGDARLVAAGICIVSIMTHTSVRIGYLVSQYPAVNHTFILREIRALRGLGWDIAVVSIRGTDRSAASLSRDEIEELRLTDTILGSGAGAILWAHLCAAVGHPRAYVRGLLYALSLAGWNARAALSHLAWFAEAVAAGAYFERKGVRHIHTHFSSTVALILARVFPIEFSVTIHGPDEFNDVAGFHLAEKVARAKFIAAISRYACSQTMRASAPRYWNKVHPLPLGVDPAEFEPSAGRAPDGRFRLLCVGRLAPAKAHHLLIEAVARLVSQGRENVLLTLVGDGPSRPSLENAVAEARLEAFVSFTGSRNHDRVIDFLRQADVFTLASFAEGVPVVLMEAMAMQVPCVATWIAGIPELIRNEIDGLLVPPADSQALATAIARLMDDSELRLRLGRAGRVRVREAYDLSHNTSLLAERFRTELAPRQQAAVNAPATL